MKNWETLAKHFADPIRSYVNDALNPILARLKSIEDSKLDIDDIIKRLPIPKNGNDGINGLDGKNGKDGQDGRNGLDGKDGVDGENGLDGKDGHDGRDGVDGENGLDGKDGNNGKDGKDALDLEILPSIDESKQYSRGTYAKHQNGLWRSFEKTSGMRGWECLVVGINSIEIEQSDDRNFRLKMTQSDGNQINKEFCMPIMIYRGVYKQGSAYEKGDTVTWGGSLWHCNQSTTIKPDDSENKHWTLAAKRGRDAK